MSPMPPRPAPALGNRWEPRLSRAYAAALLLALLTFRGHAEDAPTPAPADAPAGRPTRGWSTEFVWPGSHGHVRAGESADDLTVVLGHAIVDGSVRGHIAVLGGDVTVNGVVDGGVGCLGSRLMLGSNAVVRGNVEGFGRLEPSTGSRVLGKVDWTEDIAWPELLRQPHRWFLGLDPDSRLFLREHVFKARPLSLHLAWPWHVWAACLGPHLLALLLFRRSIRRAARLAEERPLGTLLLGLIATPLLVPLGILAGLATGGLGLPFLLLALGIGVLVGKVALEVQLGRALQSIGPRPATPQGTGEGPMDPGTLWIPYLLGSVLLVLAYLVPFLGLATWLLLGVWGLGVSLRLLFARDPRPARMTAAIAPPVPGPMDRTTHTPTVEPATASTPIVSQQPLSRPPSSQPAVPSVPTSPLLTPPTSPAAMNASTSTEIPAGPSCPVATPTGPDLLALPRAGLGLRLGALLIDVLACATFRGLLLPHWVDAWMDEMPLVGVALLVAYFAGFWVWRGATLGGLLLGLRVVRIDAGPIDGPVAIVRSLASFLSLFSGGLGQFWCAWDPEQQAWQDKLAGTVVVREGRSRPLL